MRCTACGKRFTGLTPAGNIPGHSDGWQLCPGSYTPPGRDYTQPEPPKQSFYAVSRTPPILGDWRPLRLLVVVKCRSDMPTMALRKLYRFRLNQLLCAIGLHQWVIGWYSDMAGTSRHRDCSRCGQHQELEPRD